MQIYIDLLLIFSPPNCISNFINIVECTNLKATISNYDEIKAKQNGLYTLKEKRIYTLKYMQVKYERHYR